MIDTQVPEEVQDPEVSFEQAEIDPTKLELTEEVIQLNRVAKVVKGGRRFSFSALVVVGDKNGHVGLGFGKANEVPESIRKAVDDGKKNLIYVPRIQGTIPYRLVGEFGSGRVLLRPASEGTGLIAGPAVRSVLELAGIHNLLTKSLGCSNVVNILKAVMQGLASIRDAEQVARLRGKKLEEIVGPRRAQELREGSQFAQSAAAVKPESRAARAPEWSEESKDDSTPEMSESTPPVAADVSVPASTEAVEAAPAHEAAPAAPPEQTEETPPAQG